MREDRETHYSLATNQANNGNRLTQTVGGNAYQTFTYDGHDKMLSGTAGNEMPSFDPNGNETGTTINGGTWVDKYDDEDRLISVAVPSGPTDTFTYNGLGLRVGKTDSTGTYSYVCDGTTPGSPILSDGQAVYTTGLSERRNGASLFYNNDDLGNLWTAEDGTGKAEAGAYLFTGFGVSLYAGAGAASASPLKYGGASNCQSDTDTGLVLMGHRYYDTRTGRFISQDPAGSGTNWYAYADNNPVNKTDPTGLYWAGGTVNGNPDPEEARNIAIANGADVGQTFNVVTGDGHKYSITIPANPMFDYGGASMAVPPGANLNKAIQDAKNFFNKNSGRYIMPGKGLGGPGHWEGQDKLDNYNPSCVSMFLREYCKPVR